MAPYTTFMIATRNRVGELVKTLESCLAQDWPLKEILVVDDASTDGTYETVRCLFPQVDIIRREVNGGSISARNEILRRSKGDYIIALDDDSRFINVDACRRVVKRMEAEPDLGVLSFQVIGPEHPQTITEMGRLRGEWHCSSFAACGAAIRRSMLEKTGLFLDFFFHMYEEPDLCLRVWDAGYRVLQWNEIVVYHEFSLLGRNEQRNHHRHARNEACTVIMRYPWYLVLPCVIGRLARQFGYAWRRGWAHKEPGIWFEVLTSLPLALRNRQPVGSRAVKIWLGTNRMRTTDAQAVWRLGDQGWRSILTRRTLTAKADSFPRAD